VLAEELHVATILQGSVQRSGDQVRITAQLIDAATDEHLWAESYDRPIADLFKLQSEVANHIAIALRERLTDSEKSHIDKVPTSNMEAYMYY
jgi:TolB-like protein